MQLSVVANKKRHLPQLFKLHISTPKSRSSQWRIAEDGRRLELYTNGWFMAPVSAHFRRKTALFSIVSTFPSRSLLCAVVQHGGAYGGGLQSSVNYP